MFGLEAVRTQLDSHGWAAAIGTLEEVRRAAVFDGFKETAMKTGQTKTVLRPYTVESAPMRSLSAVYGLGAQPLHTDGAHLPLPPDVIVLHSAEPTPTPTVVWHLGVLSPRMPDSIRQGIFTVRGNGSSFLASAYEKRRFRFDPVCMSPGDAYAKETIDYFRKQRSNVYVHNWDKPDSLLFIDNRQALHARDAINGDADTRSVERMAFGLEERK